MKITNKTRVTVLAKKETKGVKDPSKTYYALVILQDDDAGSISCPEEVYKAVKEDTQVDLITEYNQQFSSFRVTGMATANKQ